MIVFYTTLPSAEVAKELSHKLINAKLAACINILPAIQSIYEWQGEVCEETEVALLIKTVESKANEVQEFITQKHPYKCPCLFSVKPEFVSTKFKNFIRDSIQ